MIASFTRSHSALRARPAWRIGLVAALALTLAVAALLLTGLRREEPAPNPQAAADLTDGTQGLQELRLRFAAYLAGLSANPERDPTFLRSLHRLLDKRTFELQGFDEVFLVSGAGELIETVWGGSKAVRDGFGHVKPIVEQLIVERDGPTVADRVVARPWISADQPIVVLAASIADIWPRAAEAASTSIRIVGLKRISWTTYAHLDNVEFEPFDQPSSDQASDTFADRLSWLLAGTFGLAALLLGAVAIYYHRTTRDLAETEARSKDLLRRDPLSGLPNRLLYDERLHQALAAIGTSDGRLAVMFIDLDRFKDVNDSHGHQAGDELIQLVARRILQTLADSDTLARLGGDEFAIIQSGVTAVEDVERQARAILDALTRPFVLAHCEVTIGASIGVALAPDHATDREGLMKLADAALYQAKSEGRNRASFFQSRLDETMRMKKVVDESLRRAISGDELVLHYQPLVSADGRMIVGLEALVRWQHPVRGLISPAEFIPLAEERGLIIPLGEWVLRRACIDGRRWPGLRIAVNVSPIQFRHRGFVEGVIRVLEETGFEPSRLELELTEGVVVEDADAAEAAMVELRGLGVHLALDDFGTGYSSLIYLRRFAFDTIKIDRSFLESMEATGESAILVHSIVHLGRALGLVVTAEGVETREQHRFLQALGCHQLQGYLFSKPVPAEAIDAVLATQDGAATAA